MWLQGFIGRCIAPDLLFQKPSWTEKDAKGMSSLAKGEL